MGVTPHTAYPRLRRALAGLEARPWSGVMFRFATPRYANSADLVTGIGAARFGGRWNPPQSFPTVYGSLTPEVALAETFAVSRRYNLPDEEVTPRVIASVRVRVDRAVNLTLAANRRELGVAEGRLVTEPWRQLNASGAEALTQAIGRAAHAERLQALLVPSSVVRDGRNLVLFPDHLTPSSLDIVHADKLPRR